MPNVRGTFILEILKVLREYKEINIEDLKNHLAIYPPYIKPTTTLMFLEQMSKGLKPIIKIEGDKVSIA